MLFNSHIFIFLFLPVTLTGYFLLGSYSNRLSALWLTAASLFFYGWWNPAYVALLIGSILFNYAISVSLMKESANGNRRRGKAILITGIVIDLCLLGYYKYADFFVSTVNGMTGTDWTFSRIILPLGISFFTFTQITFLIDAFRGDVKDSNFTNYSLFVTFFPHLIAGPILHHKEMMPQFAERKTYVPQHENFSVGLTVFSIGLFKKVILADGVAPYAQAVFESASKAQSLTFIEAWAGGIGFALQLYFDFSAYSDMAVGLSRLFGVRIPLNFYSPYKAVNVIEFWRRWHISLSRFLKDYLYIPLGGSRKGKFRRYVNIMITMLLGGLWHGAGWTFVIWGGLHGIYLVINHAWHAFRRALGQDLMRSSRIGRGMASLLTFLSVVVAWVVFRAENIDAAVQIFRGMAGFNGFVLPEAWLPYAGAFGAWLSEQGVIFGATPSFARALHGPVMIISLLVISWFIPNSQQVMHKYRPAIDIYRGEDVISNTLFDWRPRWKWASVCALLFVVSIVMIDKVSEFLYSQF